jgi:hypothetical protein
MDALQILSLDRDEWKKRALAAEALWEGARDTVDNSCACRWKDVIPGTAGMRFEGLRNECAYHAEWRDRIALLETKLAEAEQALEEVRFNCQWAEKDRDEWRGKGEGK